MKQAVSIVTNFVAGSADVARSGSLRRRVSALKVFGG